MTDEETFRPAVDGPEGERTRTHSYAGRDNVYVSGDWIQAIHTLSDPAVVVATATAGAAVANKLIGEAGKTLRQSMIEKTNRQNGTTSAETADDPDE